MKTVYIINSIYSLKICACNGSILAWIIFCNEGWLNEHFANICALVRMTQHGWSSVDIEGEHHHDTRNWSQKCTPSRLGHPSFNSWLMVTTFLLKSLDDAHGWRCNNCPMMTQDIPRPSCMYAAKDKMSRDSLEQLKQPISFSPTWIKHISGTLEIDRKSAIPICDTCKPPRTHKKQLSI